jgi:uncharacterized protein (TIGR00251 family)
MRSRPADPHDPWTLSVKVKPRASRTRILGFKAGQLEVSLAAPPVDGAANSELRRCLAEALGVGISCVQIRQGAHSKTKLVEVSSVATEARERWISSLPQS